MPVYEYIALDSGGRRRKGIVDAGSIAAARQKLRETEVFPVEIVETADRKREETAARGGAIRLFKRVGLRELALMTRQLATLIGAGLPLVPSLAALVAQIRHPVLKTTLAQIKDEVNEGMSLTQSMSHFPEVFPPFYINMVRAGEASGTINLVLDRLADFNESQQALRTKIRSALAYPLFMFFIGSGVLFFLVTFVVPNITNIFREMHQTLPGITVFLLVVSGFFKDFWWIIALILAAGDRRPALFHPEDGTGPAPVGPLQDHGAAHRSAEPEDRRGALQPHPGHPPAERRSPPGRPGDREERREQPDHRRADPHGGQGCRGRGEPLRPPLPERFFPPIAVEMITVGEQSGNMEAMLFRIADSYEKEVEANVLLVTSLLEPAMILVMGAVVGFIVISVLLPIFEMNQLVR